MTAVNRYQAFLWDTIGQISHDIPAWLLVLIIMIYRVPEFHLLDYMVILHFAFFLKRRRIATNSGKNVPSILNVARNIK